MNQIENHYSSENLMNAILDALRESEPVIHVGL